MASLCLTYQFTTLPSRSICVVTNGRIPSSLMAESIPLYVLSSSIHLWIDTGFPILAIEWNASIDRSEDNCDVVSLFHLDIHPEAELLGHLAVLFLAF